MASAANELAAASSDTSRYGILAQGMHSFACYFRDHFIPGVQQVIRYTDGRIFSERLQLHMTEVSQITQEVDQTDSRFGRRLLSLKTRISYLNNYYDNLCVYIKGIVDYGTEMIPKICNLIDEKQNYNEAIKIIGSFLDALGGRIEMVEKYIEEIQQVHCKDIDEIEQQVQIVIDEYSDANKVLIEKIDKEKTELVNVGYMIYYSEVAATFLPKIATMAVTYVSSPEEFSAALSEAFKHAVDTVSTGTKRRINEQVQSIVEKYIKFPNDLRKKVESNASKIRNSFDYFFSEISSFKIKIHTITGKIGILKNCSNEVQKELKNKPIDPKDIPHWINISMHLKQICETLKDLKTKVIEKKRDTD